MECSLLNNGLFFYPDEDNTSQNKPCCTFGSANPSKSKNISIHSQLQRLTIQEYDKFYDDPFRKLHIRLLNKGNKPDACSSCWKHEDVGYPSMRTRINQLNFCDNSNKLKYFELNTGNTCNIQCIMCNPSDSLKTKTYYEHVITEYSSLGSKINRKHKFAKGRGLRKSDIDNIKWDQFKDLEYLKITGGETFYTKEFWYFLNKLIENNLAKNISLIVVTNNTVQLTSDRIEIFKEFNKIKIFSSVDGIGNLCDTIRAGSKWNEVEQNIKHLIELHKEFPQQFLHTEPHSVIQFANILQLDDIVNWWENIAINEEFKNKHYLRILDQPKWFEPGIVNNEVKNLAINKYKDIKKLNHVVKYLHSYESNDDFLFKYTVPIFEQVCRINNQDPFNSKAYEVIKNA